MESNVDSASSLYDQSIYSEFFDFEDYPFPGSEPTPDVALKEGSHSEWASDDSSKIFFMDLHSADLETKRLSTSQQPLPSFLSSTINIIKSKSTPNEMNRCCSHNTEDRAEECERDYDSDDLDELMIRARIKSLEQEELAKESEQEELVKVSEQEELVKESEQMRDKIQILKRKYSSILHLTYKAMDTNKHIRRQYSRLEFVFFTLKQMIIKKKGTDQSKFKKTTDDKIFSIRDITRGFLNAFASPYFKDDMGFCHETYGTTPEDAKLKKIIGIVFSSRSSTNKQFRETNVHNLSEVIKNYLIQTIADKKKLIIPPDQLQKMGNPKSAMKTIIKEVNNLKKKNLPQLLNMTTIEFDWLQISNHATLRGLSPDECKRIWELIVYSSMKFGKWKPKQVELLRKLAEKNSYQNWDSIAKQINPNLSAFLVFVQFRKRYSNILMNKGSWTTDEDKRLLELVEYSSYGKNNVLWGKVFYYLDDRTVNQVLNRWYRLNPSYKHGKFSPIEDALLENAVKQFGNDFGKIASVFGTRSPVQLRERFIVQNQCDIKMGEWSLEEDRLLLKLIKEYGESKWVDIARAFPSRNRTQIRHRYTSVLKKKLEKNPNFDIETLTRHKRNTHNNILNHRKTSEALDRSALKIIQETVDKGEAVVKKRNRSGRKPSSTETSFTKEKIE